MDGSGLKENLKKFQEEMADAARRAGRSVQDITLVAVSKTHGPDRVAELYNCGQRIFGENYVQEAAAKMDELSGLGIDWHFIGHLQSNKARQVAGRFAMVQTVHSAKLARRLNDILQGTGGVQPVLVQVNLGEEKQKSGVRPEESGRLCTAIEEMSGLDLKGLMVLPPFFEDGEKSRPYFARLRQLKEKMERELGRRLPHLSMGMTADFPQAIEEGATLIRVGTRLFGPREYK
ncbi:MAG: YggS family pyridoxal phosphate-dependent enzyme [Desulfonatronovibrionaceae bacterium]